MPLLTIQAFWIGVIIGLLSRTYTHFLGTLAMTNWFLMLKKGLLTILHHTSFFTENFECSPGSTKNLKGVFCKGVLLFQRLSLYNDLTYNPSPVRELSLLTQFSGFTTLQSLVLEKHFKGAQSSMVLSMRSDNLTYNRSPSNS